MKDTEFIKCAACDRVRWKYNLCVTTEPVTYRGLKIRKGAKVCFDHKTLVDKKAREALAKFNASRPRNRGQ